MFNRILILTIVCVFAAAGAARGKPPEEDEELKGASHFAGALFSRKSS